MTTTDITLMVALVIGITLILMKMSAADDIIKIGICLLGGVTYALVSMVFISAYLRGEVKVDTLTHGNYAVQQLPNSSDYVVTEVRAGADKVLYKLDDIDAPAIGIDHELNLDVYKIESMVFRFIMDAEYRGKYKDGSGRQ